MQRGMKTITVNSLSGGQGKTTASQMLLLLLSRYGSVLGVDADPQANLSLLMGAQVDQSAPSCLELINGSCEPKDCIYPYELEGSTRRENLFLVPADDGLESAQEFLTGTGMTAMVLRQRLKEVSDLFDFCVIDSPPARSHLSMTVMGAADYVLIPVEASTKGVGSLLRTFEVIEKLRKFVGQDGVNVMGVIPFRDKWVGNTQTNKSKQAIEMIKEECAERNIAVFPSILESEQYGKAANAGMLVEELGYSDLQLPFDEIVSVLTSEKSAEAA